MIKKKRNCPSRKYSIEEDEWLKEYYPCHPYKETLQEFQKKFNRVVSERGFLSHCYKHLGMTNQKHYFTKEQETWIVNNYFKYKSANKFHKDFCNKFGKGRSLQSILNKCSKLNVKSQRFYSDEELEWIKQNYESATLDIVHKKFCEKFREVSFEGFITVAKMHLKLGRYGRGQFKKGNINHITKMRIEMNVPNDMILSDLGDGRRLPMDKKIHKKLSREKGNLCNGLITETLYDLEVYKREIKKLLQEED